MENEKVLTVNNNGEIKETELETTPMVFNADFMDLMSKKSEQLKSKNFKTGLSLSPVYKEFEKGESIKVVFLGFKLLQKKDNGGIKELPAVIWMDEKQATWVNAGASLVSAFESVPEGTAVMITFTGEKPVQTGNLKQYEVKPIFFD